MTPIHPRRLTLVVRRRCWRIERIYETSPGPSPTSMDGIDRRGEDEDGDHATSLRSPFLLELNQVHGLSTPGYERPEEGGEFSLDSSSSLIRPQSSKRGSRGRPGAPSFLSTAAPDQHKRSLQCGPPLLCEIKHVEQDQETPAVALHSALKTINANINECMPTYATSQQDGGTIKNTKAAPSRRESDVVLDDNDTLKGRKGSDTDEPE
ncbi:unnamed protein product, partial [Amoebophrya sp. A120]|eukprot:GSA120T00015059001.1